MLPTNFSSFGQAISEQIFRNRPTRNKNWLWRQCFLTDQVKISNPYRGPSIDAFTQFWFIWLSGSEKKIFRNWPTRNMNYLLRQCLFIMDRNDQSKLYRWPSTDVSYQVSVHLAKRFQRRRFLKLTNQKQELPMAAMFVNGSEWNEQSK